MGCNRDVAILANHFPESIFRERGVLMAPVGLRRRYIAS
jgi:hypothetical protein